MKIFFVLCVISLSVSVVFNQDIKETSIDIYRSVKVKSDAHKSHDDSSSNSYKALVKYTNDKTYVKSVGTAIADVLNEFFIKQNIPFDILIFHYINYDTKDVIGEIGKILSDNYATTVKKIDYKNTININQSALILTDVENIEIFNRWVNLANVFPKKLKFLIYTHKSGDLFDAPKVLISIAHISQFEYFIVDKNKEELELTTFEWFTDTKCNFKTYKVLNTFNRNSLNWQQKLENHEKFKNLHNCMIHVNAFQGIYYQALNSKKQSLVFDMMDIVAQRRNFIIVQGAQTAKIEIPVGDEVKKLHLDYNVVMDINFLTEYMSYHFTTTFAEESVLFMITPGELYTSYEKILLPFDELTWYFLIATFGIAFGSIFVGNFLPKYVQDYLYGEGIKIPAFNVIGTFFGIGQLRLPATNFPRMILMIFILFCLIIRTAYQGVMFDMMTKEMRKSSPQTVDDLFEWNFSVNLITVNSNFIPISRMFYENIDEHRQNITKKFNYLNLNQIFCSTIFNPEEKFAVNTGINLYYILTNFCKKAPMLLNEEFVRIPLGIAIRRNSFLYEAVEEVMQLTIPAGIPQYWRKYHRWYQHERNHYTEIEKTGAQILRLEDLSFGFIIWLIACGVAVLGLLCELIVFAISKLKRLTRVEPIQVNNTNVLLPKKPIKIKVKKAKKQREPTQQKSTLDAQILMEIQDEIINKNKIELNPSKLNVKNDKNIQQAKIYQEHTTIQIQDVIDERIESKISSTVSTETSPKIEEPRIDYEDEKTGKQDALKAKNSKNQQDVHVIGVEKDIDCFVHILFDSKNASRSSAQLSSRISTELSSKEDRNGIDEFKKNAKSLTCTNVDVEE